MSAPLKPFYLTGDADAPVQKPRPRRRNRSRLPDLCAAVRRMAHELGPQAKLPTVVQLQKILGVSVATLDRVLTELEQQQVIYRQQGKGIFVCPTLHRHLCFVCDPSFFSGAGTSPFWSILLEKVHQQTVRRSETFSMHFSAPYGIDGPPLHDGFVDELMAGRIHGVFGIGLSYKAAQWIEAQQVPLVGFATPCKHRIVLDSGSLIRQAVQSLVERGCRRIGYWKAVGPFRPKDYDDGDILVFQNELVSQGLTFDPALLYYNPALVDPAPEQVGLTHQEQGYQAALALLDPSGPPKPDGIVVTDDMMAQGMLAAFHRLNVQVGGDIKIAAHTNKGAMTLLGYEHVLTRLEYDPAELVQAMFALMDCQLADQAPDESVVSIPSHLLLCEKSLSADGRSDGKLMDAPAAVPEI